MHCILVNPLHNCQDHKKHRTLRNYLGSYGALEREGHSLICGLERSPGIFEWL